MMKSKRYCKALDLRDDLTLIAEYEAYHKRIWPEITAYLKNSGIENMEIWRIGTRLFMIMDVSGSYDPDLMNDSEINQQWEQLMSQYQTLTPWSSSEEKWVDLTKIFDLSYQ